MPNILVCGKGCAVFAAGLRRALRQQSGGDAADFCIFTTNTAPDGQTFDAVIVRGGIRPQCSSRLRVVIVEGPGYAGDEDTVTCGLGSGCDLSFSSARAGRLQICLSRPLSGCGGRVEPCERSVRGTLGTAETVLSAYALRFYFDHDSKN